MASSRTTRAAEARDPPLAALRSFLESQRPARGMRVAVALSGGMDSVVLLHAMHAIAADFGLRVSALHVNHGLSPDAPRWARHCRALCAALGVPITVRRVRVETTRGDGLEAAARRARHAVFAGSRADAITLAHHLDDQAETVLLRLLRGAGVRGASAMRPVSHQAGMTLWRPLLATPRAALRAHAARHRLAWVEDASNRDETRTRNFIRHRVAPLIEQRFPRWREALGRAARHFAASHTDAQALLRAYLETQGLRAPSEAKLVEMLRQLIARGARTELVHDGVLLGVYRDALRVAPRRAAPHAFAPLAWRGEARLRIDALGGEVRFRRVRGTGIARERLEGESLTLRARRGGERLQVAADRPHRSLKNLFQEAGVPPRERALPLLYCGERLVWVPGLGIEASFQACAGRPGIAPEWRADDAA